LPEYDRLGAPLNGFVREEQDRGVLRRSSNDPSARARLLAESCITGKIPILDVIAEWTASRAQGNTARSRTAVRQVAVKHLRKP
jgi:hypothetical protein